MPTADGAPLPPPGAMSSTSSVTNNLDVPGADGGAAAAAPLATDENILPRELLELRERLDFLKNMYDIAQDENEVCIDAE